MLRAMPLLESLELRSPSIEWTHEPPAPPDEGEYMAVVCPLLKTMELEYADDSLFQNAAFPALTSLELNRFLFIDDFSAVFASMPALTNLQCSFRFMFDEHKMVLKFSTPLYSILRLKKLVWHGMNDWLPVDSLIPILRCSPWLERVSVS